MGLVSVVDEESRAMVQSGTRCRDGDRGVEPAVDCISCSINPVKSQILVTVLRLVVR